MSDSQEDSYKNIIWSYGLKIDDAAERLGMRKQTLYNNIRKVPITESFAKKWTSFIQKLDKESTSGTKNINTNNNTQTVGHIESDMGSQIVYLKALIDRLEKKLDEKERELKICNAEIVKLLTEKK